MSISQTVRYNVLLESPFEFMKPAQAGRDRHFLIQHLIRKVSSTTPYIYQLLESLMLRGAGSALFLRSKL